MKTGVKILYFYGLWYLCAWSVSRELIWLPLGLSLASVIVDFLVWRYPLGVKRYFAFTAFLCVSGPALELGLKKLGLIDWEGFYPLGMLGIWLFFSVYYPELFALFRKRLALGFILGAVFGPLAYYSGALLNALTWQADTIGAVVLFGVLWGGYFVLTLGLFNWLDQPKRPAYA